MRTLLVLNFFCRDFVKQLLEPSERAQKSRHHPPQQRACENEESHHIPCKLELGGADHRLKRPDGARSCRGRTGVAIQPGDADGLQAGPGDPSMQEVHQKGVGSQRGPQLDLPAMLVFSQCPHTAKHRLTPLCRTMSASPRHSPSPIISRAAARQQNVIFLISAHSRHSGAALCRRPRLERGVPAHLHKGGRGRSSSSASTAEYHAERNVPFTYQEATFGISPSSTMLLLLPTAAARESL